MPRLVNRPPSYRLHRPSGQAIVSLGGADVYLGAYGSTESRQEYDRHVAEWLTRGRRSLAGAGADRRVADVITAYWDFAGGYYPGPEGRTELGSLKLALSLLRRLYGHTPARDFGPLALQAVRREMISGAGWSRTYVNAQVGRLKRCFKWAASQELVPPAMFHGLQAVAGLRRGKTEARETAPVRPVAEEWVEQTLPHVSAQVRALIRLQLASGMRPGEAVIMRGCDLDTSGAVWAYRPSRHKTEHHGHERTVYLGPKAQAVVRPFLRADTSAYLFSPAEAERDRREELTRARKTPLSCGNRPGTNVAQRPRKRAADRYTVDSYRRAIAYGCDLAFPPPEHLRRGKVKGQKGTRRETGAEWKARLGPKRWGELVEWREAHRWHPHQLRHTAATRLRKQFGLEAARVVLGQHSAAVAEIYAKADLTKAEQITGEVG